MYVNSSPHKLKIFLIKTAKELTHNQELAKYTETEMHMEYKSCENFILQYHSIISTESDILRTKTMHVKMTAFSFQSNTCIILMQGPRHDLGQTISRFFPCRTRIVRESDYSPASQLFCRVKKTMTGNYHKLDLVNIDAHTKFGLIMSIRY